MNSADLWNVAVRAKQHSSLTHHLGRMVGQGRNIVHTVLLFVIPAMHIVYHMLSKARFSCCISVRKPQNPNMQWHKKNSVRNVPVPIITTQQLCCACGFFVSLFLCCCLIDWWHLPRAMQLQISWLFVCLLTICCDSRDQCVQSVRINSFSEAQGVSFLVHLYFFVLLLDIVNLLFSVSWWLLDFLCCTWYPVFCWVLV